jgi:hypothetical protein
MCRQIEDDRSAGWRRHKRSPFCIQTDLSHRGRHIIYIKRARTGRAYNAVLHAQEGLSAPRRFNRKHGHNLRGRRLDDRQCQARSLGRCDACASGDPSRMAPTMSTGKAASIATPTAMVPLTPMSLLYEFDVGRLDHFSMRRRAYTQASALDEHNVNGDRTTETASPPGENFVHLFMHNCFRFAYGIGNRNFAPGPCRCLFETAAIASLR